MHRPLSALLVLLVVLGLGACGPSIFDPGPIVFGPLYAWALTESGELILIDVKVPGTVLARLSVTGLEAGDTLIALAEGDYDGTLGRRPIYGLGEGDRFYAIDPATGVATPLGTGAFTPALTGLAFDFVEGGLPDTFDVYGDLGKHWVVSTADGLATPQPDLAYDAGDPNAGTVPDIAGASVGTLGLGLALLDVQADVLATTGPGLVTVLDLGVDVTLPAAFDLAQGFDTQVQTSLPPPREYAFFAFRPVGGGGSRLFRVELGLDEVTEVGEIGAGEVVVDLAVVD